MERPERREEAAKIALEEATRQLAAQDGELSALHARASFVLAAAGIATGTVLGRRADLGGFGISAIVFFGLAAALAVYVLFPRFDGWKSSLDATRTMPVQKENHLSSAAVREWLVRLKQANYMSNRNLLRSLYTLFWWACVCLAVAIGCTLLSFALD